MVLDLEKIPQGLKKQYIETGKTFGSSDTLSQALQTLTEFEKHREVMGKFGFMASDAQKLKEIYDTLMAMSVLREQARGDKRRTSQSHVVALQQAKKIRDKARTLLTIVEHDLQLAASAEAVECQQQLHAALKNTQSSDVHSIRLIDQLKQLQYQCENPLIARYLKERLNDTLSQELAKATTALELALKENQQSPGTKGETEKMDLLDGMIVQAVRHARKSARAAAHFMGQPAIAKAFELSKLYAPAPNTKKENSSTETTTSVY